MTIRLKKTEPTKEWLDQSGCFIFGKYRGESAEDIADTDSSYIRWIVDNVEDILESDREVLSQYLTYAQRRR